MFGNLSIFSFVEFIFQSWDEFGVDLHAERLNFLDDIWQWFFSVAWELLHFFVPAIYFFQLFAS